MSRGPAITIGNFDGVHCGHQALIRACRNLAGPGGRTIVLAFEPHPATVLRPDSVPPRLGTFEQRCQWLLQTGADEVVALAPAAETLSQAPGTFVESICRKWRPIAIVEGPDFRFGHQRAGSVEDLKRLGPALGFEAVVIDPVVAVLADQTEAPVSSTMIRWLLARGRVADAAAMLGRPYELQSTVRRGRQRGRELGFPTVNLADNGCLLPADGVYAGEAELPDGSTRTAAISVGCNPTFADAERSCEAYLLDFGGWREEYGWQIRLAFHSWMRDQLVFRSVDALKSQLLRDIRRVAHSVSPNASTAQTR